MLPFNELPQSLVKELGLYVKQNTHNILEYDFIDIPNKFDWCYFSTDIIFSVDEARTKLKQLKFNYIQAFKRYTK